MCAWDGTLNGKLAYQSRVVYNRIKRQLMYQIRKKDVIDRTAFARSTDITFFESLVCTNLANKDIFVFDLFVTFTYTRCSDTCL